MTLQKPFLRTLRTLMAAMLVLSVVAPAAAETVIVEVGLSDELRAGADENGAPLVYAPNPVEPGSSISHFDRTAFPNLLMEPSINGDLPGGGLDLTVVALRDLGWPSGQANIQLNYTDAAGTGFDDPTLGAQRKAAMERAAEILGNAIGSGITIHIDVAFIELTCENGGGTLAQAGARFIYRDFQNAPLPGIWYHAALAESLSGQNLSIEDDPSPTSAEIRARFNTKIDDGCLGANSSYFYGLSGNAPGGQISFINTALHEIGHGLGFSSFVDESDGSGFLGSTGVFDHFVVDKTRNRRWSRMTTAQRRVSATNTGNVIFDGPMTRRQASNLLVASPAAIVSAPGDLAGDFRGGSAVFGPELRRNGPMGELVLIKSRGGQPTLGCNGTDQNLDGKVALIDRGECPFVDKVMNAQRAGAIAVIIANNVSTGAIGMGGDGPNVRIPAVSVSMADGALLKLALADDGGGDGNGDGDGDGDGDGGTASCPNETPGACVAGNNTLCLNQGRFKVELDFMTQDQRGGQATANDLTDDTGYFTFFNPNNVEIVVKTLDACTTFDRFWVFAAGLTNVEATLKVVDTQTGQAKCYSNPLNNPFQPIQDTDAFATCQP